MNSKPEWLPVYPVGFSRWRKKDQDAFIAKQRCVKCKQKRTPEGHDPCIANLPGVANACCGHGVGQGYVCFAVASFKYGWCVIRGDFEHIHPKPHEFL